MRYLGVDPGGRRMGLAVGDDVSGIASPVTVVAYTGAGSAAEVIAAAAARLGAEHVVLGLPLDSHGERTAACARTDAIARAVVELGLEVSLQGEHLTTHEARRRAREAGLPRSRPVDHLAAQVLLEEFLARPRPAGSGDRD